MAPILYNENFRTPVTKSINHVESAHSKIKTHKRKESLMEMLTNLKYVSKH